MPSKALRVLVVDDERLVADTLAIILNRTRHVALAAYDGLEAVDAVKSFNPDVILSDVMMPGWNGFQVARYVAENLPNCKVLLMCGHDGAREMAREFFLESDVPNVLTKPVMPETILRFIESCCE